MEESGATPVENVRRRSGPLKVVGVGEGGLSGRSLLAGGDRPEIMKSFFVSIGVHVHSICIHTRPHFALLHVRHWRTPAAKLYAEMGRYCTPPRSGRQLLG